MVPTALLLTIFCESAGAWKTSLKLTFRKRYQPDRREIEDAKRFLQLCGKLGLWLGLLNFLLGLILTFADLSDPMALGPNLSVTLIAPFYGICIYILCMLADHRIEYKYGYLLNTIEQPQRPSEGEQPQRSYRWLKLGLFSGCLIVLFAGALAYFFLFASVDHHSLSPEESQKRLEQFLKDAPPFYTPRFSFSVRLADRENIASISLSTMMKDPITLEYLLAREPAVNDVIIRRLSEFDGETLAKKNGMALAEQELLIAINAFIDDDFLEYSKYPDSTPVKRVLFDKFLIIPLHMLPEIETLPKTSDSS